MEREKLGIKEYIFIASMLFGMFFGAGNLIFPIHLGQLAGSQWLAAGIGFLITGTILPLLAIVSISITRSNGIYDLAKPIGERYATFFMVMVCATLGPLFATPRTATTPFQIAFGQSLSPSQTPIALLIYSAIFFSITYSFSKRPMGIIDSIGKLLNPAFLILLTVIFVFSFTRPLGKASLQATTALYHSGSSSFLNGFLQGYNTMDAIAGLLFGIAIVTTIKGLGIKRPTMIAKVAAKSSVLSITLEALIYMVLIWIGATSLEYFKISADGGIGFSQIAMHFLGLPGQIILAIMATLACLTTSIGLSTSFAEAMHSKFPKIRYEVWNILTCSFSFVFANVGLDQIIAWSTPMLMFLYPLAITLIALSIASPLFKKTRIIYIMTTAFTIIPAIIDAIASAPAVISTSSWAKIILSIDKRFLPFAGYGMDWILPATIGFTVGLIIYLLKKGTVKDTIMD
ncbi:branched-chain amino acid transport system II carrier protein [Pediococcus stilesii]|uniref:Branched-chain amino acid transport system carrier protein n=1 Tax=Pediococcus stilesii TaxID=331679 RepID=A0A5R9BYZ6_9LACO|nr:branched-chain amino acid transport system II carrier protein [Pediococcus stilesii]TLQ05705.1 branched-chain amino acid transport system II carrier protein [Pediococcus stilesii]